MRSWVWASKQPSIHDFLRHEGDPFFMHGDVKNRLLKNVWKTARHRFLTVFAHILQACSRPGRHADLHGGSRHLCRLLCCIHVLALGTDVVPAWGQWVQEPLVPPSRGAFSGCRGDAWCCGSARGRGFCDWKNKGSKKVHLFNREWSKEC